MEQVRLVEDYMYYDDTSPSCLRWKRDNGARAKRGGVACGTLRDDGYYQGTFNDSSWSAHRIVYYLHHGVWSGKDNCIDHIDGNQSNNRIDNLRMVTHKENSHNRTRANKNTKSNEIYVYDNPYACNPYRVVVKRKYIGTYRTIEEAVVDRDMAMAEWRSQSGRFAPKNV